jgi:anti-sigma factor RsiW
MNSPDPVMPSPTPPRVTEDELHALVDGQLGPAERQALEARLADDEAATAKLAVWCQQRERLRELHRVLLDEPLPPALQSAANRATASAHARNQWWRWGGMAASIVLAFGTGWTTHSLWQAASPSAAGQLAQARSSHEFARQASVAHAIYSPEVRHPVEVTAAEQAHLVQWLSRRLGRPLKLPDLSPQGYDLVGGRLLPGEQGARAQFMFQNSSGTRLTLYLGAVAAGASAAGSAETAFRFLQEGPVPGFYWVDQGFGYALAGPLSRQDLLRLAQAIHPQL